jgi:AAA domain
MARRFYMSLSGVGDWPVAMGEAGAQLPPYRNYLKTAKRAADARALSLAWRAPSREEEEQLERRLVARFTRDEPRPQQPLRRRDQRRPASAPSGTWIILEPRPGHPEEPATTFEAFLEAKDVHDWPPDGAGRREDSKIDVRTFDQEGLALLLARSPTPIAEDAASPDQPREPRAPPAPRGPIGPLLFLCPNTWPLECQRHTLDALESRPVPRLEPLLRLVSTRPQWPPVEPARLPEPAWAFLRRERDESLRDGTTEQRAFVEGALATPDFALLEGPPGSGKTTAICELIVQLVRAGKRLLLTASTHVAVDNVLERLIAWQDEAQEQIVLPVRIGDEHQITSPAVEAWTLRSLTRTWRAQLLDHLERPSDVDPAGEAARRMMQEALTRDEADGLVSLILESSNLVCGTTIGILQHPEIKASRRGQAQLEPFDFLILDEASKTTFAEFLVPALYAGRWIVVGDRRQLSPYVDEQDLAENLDGLLPPEVSRAAVHAFVASSAVPPSARLRSLVAVRSTEEARWISEEAAARGVAAVDLDAVRSADKDDDQGRCMALLCADLVFGQPETIAAWEHRLPGDLEAIAGDVPALPDWQAHRRALGTRTTDEPVTWAREVAWRQIRSHELRDNLPEQKRLLLELGELLPKALGDWHLKKRPRRAPPGSSLPSPAQALEDELASVRRVAMPSILEILQRGAGSLGWQQRTALTDGLPPAARRERMISLSFQHRMHPDISAFPRSKFYAADDLLKDAAGMTSARAWTYGRYQRRAVWLQIAPRRTRRGEDPPATANSNPAEADALMSELQEFARWAASAPRPGQDPQAPWQVAVISFYRGQEKLLRRRLQAACGQPGNTRNFQLPRVHVTLCTADRFQGHEADLVLLSFVKSGSVGFLNSPNRLNVALTRARYQLVLIGDRGWMDSPGCRSALLRALASSELYAHDFAWEAP